MSSDKRTGEKSNRKTQRFIPCDPAFEVMKVSRFPIVAVKTVSLLTFYLTIKCKKPKIEIQVSKFNFKLAAFALKEEHQVY